MTEKQREAARRRWANPVYRQRQIEASLGPELRIRFWSHVDRRTAEECWPWLGATTRTGYGSYSARVNGKAKGISPHRFAYEDAKGAIPSGLTIDHLCENKLCCNPAHLEAVSLGENIRRWHARHNAPTCPKGHPFTPENTYHRKNHGRACLTCVRDYAREHQRDYRRLGRDKEARARWTPEQREERRRKHAEAERRRYRARKQA